MLFVTNYANCSSYTHHIINLFCLPKEKRYNSTLNLTLMTVIIYTGNKVKSTRGKKRKKASTIFFSFGQQTLSHENILHLVDILGENITEFCTFVVG